MVKLIGNLFATHTVLINPLALWVVSPEPRPELLVSWRVVELPDWVRGFGFVLLLLLSIGVPVAVA
jgi:hypothetical protein